MSSSGFDSNCRNPVGTGSAELSITNPISEEAFGWDVFVTESATGEPILVVADWESDTNGDDSGAVYLFTGDLRGDLSTTDASARLFGYAPGDAAGSIVGAANVDADPEPELLIGVGGLDLALGGGAIFVVDVPTSGDVVLDSATFPLVHGQSGILDGIGIAGEVVVGDFSGDDGLPELALATPFHGFGRGALYVFEYPHTGQRSTDDAFYTYKDDLGGPKGVATDAACGDVDADGGDDLVLGARVGSTGFGEYTLIEGPLARGVYAPADATHHSTEPGNHIDIGQAVDVGDFDGDGTVDILVMGTRWDAGQDNRPRVWVLDDPMAATLGDGAMAVITGQGGNPLTGEGLMPEARFVGDLDGDGKADLALSTPSSDSVTVAFGGTVGTVDASGLYGQSIGRPAFVVQGPTDSGLGFGIASGFVSSDSHTDLLLGAANGNLASLIYGGRW